MKGVKYEGILTALVTPLKEDNKTVNESCVKELIEFQLGQGANGFYILGGTGEGPVIAPEERIRMCETAVKCVAGRKPVICHIAAMNLNEAIMLAKQAEKSGADAIAAIPPLFFFYDENDIFNYYKKIAESVSIPLIIYYHPSAQKDMSAKLIARLFEIDNITGVKWSSTNYFEMMNLKDLTQGDMNIINGPDELLVCGLMAGADAGIGSTDNFMLPEFVSIYNLFKAGKIDEARAVQMKVNRVIQLAFKHEVIPMVKQATAFMGFDVGEPTYPMRHMSDAEKEELAAELKALGWPFTPINR